MVEEWVVFVYAPEAEAPDYLVSAGRYARAVEDWRAAAAALAPPAAEASSSSAAASSSSAEGVAFRMAWRDHDGSFAFYSCLLYTSPSPRDKRQSRMPSSA